MTIDGEYHDPVGTENVCVISHIVFNVCTDSFVRNVFMVDTLFTEFPYSISISCKWSVYGWRNTALLNEAPHREDVWGGEEGVVDALFTGCACSYSHPGHSTAVERTYGTHWLGR